MNRIFIVTYSNLMEDENDQIIGTFPTRKSALYFITYLRKEKRILDGIFEVHLVEGMSVAQNIENYVKGVSTTTLVASTWCTEKALNLNQVVLYDNGNEEIVELYKEKENDN